MMSHSPRCKINLNRDANNINSRVADLMELVKSKDEMRDLPLNNTTGPGGANDHETIDLDTLVKLSSVRGETSPKVYNPQLNLPTVHLLIQHTIKELVTASIMPEGKLIYSTALGHLLSQNLATHRLTQDLLNQLYKGPKLLYPMSVLFAKDKKTQDDNRRIVDNIVNTVITQYNDRDHDYYAVMSFGTPPHWYLILLTTNHRRSKEFLREPEILSGSGAPTGGRITVTYQSVNQHPLKKWPNTCTGN